MDGKRLVLNDGTTIEDGQAGYSEGFLWCFFSGNMQQAASLFFDPSKTGKIIFQYGELENTYEGFTNCTSINMDVDGNVSVCLKKGA